MATVARIEDLKEKRNVCAEHPELFAAELVEIDAEIQAAMFEEKVARALDGLGVTRVTAVKGDDGWSFRKLIVGS